MDYKETIKQIAKMISSGDLPKTIYDKYLSKAPIGFMNCEELENFLLKENEELKKKLKEKEEWIKLLSMFKNQQKEFINWLEAKIKGYEAISDLLFNHNKELKVYKEVLAKYKEIIGEK